MGPWISLDPLDPLAWRHTRPLLPAPRAGTARRARRRSARPRRTARPLPSPTPLAADAWAAVYAVRVPDGRECRYATRLWHHRPDWLPVVPRHHAQCCLPGYYLVITPERLSSDAWRAAAQLRCGHWCDPDPLDPDVLDWLRAWPWALLPIPSQGG